MSKKNQMLIHAERIASHLVAEQTRARIALGFDAAILAAHEVFQMGPGRAAAFAQAYSAAMEELAGLFIDDSDQSGKQIEYAKAKRDEAILAIVGPENFQPFDRTYGEAWVDELKRIRVMEGKTLAEAWRDTAAVAGAIFPIDNRSVSPAAHGTIQKRWIR